VNANQGSNMCQFLSLWLDSTGSRTPDLPHSERTLEWRNNRSPTQEEEIDTTLSNKLLYLHIIYQNENKIGLKMKYQVLAQEKEIGNIYIYKKSFYP